MWVKDSHSERVDRWSASIAEPMVVSGWAVAEFSSALGVRRRHGDLNDDERQAAELALDIWLTSVDQVEIVAVDFVLARQLMRVDALPVKAPDALHIAVAKRIGAVMATVDRQLRHAAEGFDVSTIRFEAFD